MLTKRRKDEILQRLHRDGQIVAKALSRELGLSEDTIRRDLRELAHDGLLLRVHGGALPASPAVANFASRLNLGPTGKAAIGRVAASLVRPNQIICIDGGTTALQMARHLPENLRATVVTHSPSIAVALVDHANIDVEVIGGRLFKHSIVAAGAATLEAIARIRPDTYYMGVTGVHAELGLTTGDSEEASVKRALCKSAAETIVLASGEKLGAASPYGIVPLDAIDAIVVDCEPALELVQRLDALEIEIIRAPR